MLLDIQCDFFTVSVQVAVCLFWRGKRWTDCWIMPSQNCSQNRGVSDTNWTLCMRYSRSLTYTTLLDVEL